MTKITLKQKETILTKNGFKFNPVMKQLFGEGAWFPKNAPLDLNLPKKAISESELSMINNELELLDLIKLKLK
jgi:hypothetical protein